MNDLPNPRAFRGRRALSLSISLLLGCVIIWGIVHLLFPNVGKHSKAQAELLQLFENIQINDHVPTVESKFQDSRFHYLTLVKAREGLWIVQTPFKTGASNWNLWIEFSESKVAMLKIRTADYPKQRPEGAPADKG
jgi:hypothetical protein